MQAETRSFWVVYGAAIVIAATGFLVAYHFVGAPPPQKFQIAAGSKKSAYYAFAKQYAAFMKKRGIILEIRETGGAVENLKLMRDPNSGVDVALIQSGLMDADDTENLVGVGSVCFEPLWVFVRADKGDITLLSDLKGKRIAIGNASSGTRPLGMKLLTAAGISETNSTLLSLGGTNAVNALLNDHADAMFFVAAVESELVQRLLEDERVTALSFLQADAYARKFRFLSAIRLPQGALDLAHNRPPQDIRLVSPAATLVARSTTHPALVDLLLQAASSVHGNGDTLTERGQFPSPLYLDAPLSPFADRYFKYGPPFLQRFLPFWLAVTVERVKVMIVPLLVLLLPIFKFLPTALQWRTRRKITRWYRHLYALDERISQAGEKELREALAEIDQVEREVLLISVPLDFADQLYNLRSHLLLVRDRTLSRMKTGAAGKDVAHGK
jgi:TRAP transporter TAXI family solute receptor